MLTKSDTMFSTRIATQIYAKICFETTPGQKKIIEKLSEYIADDEYVEVTPQNVRLRKKYLSELERKKVRNAKKSD